MSQGKENVQLMSWEFRVLQRGHEGGDDIFGGEFASGQSSRCNPSSNIKSEVYPPGRQPREKNQMSSCMSEALPIYKVRVGCQ